MPRKECDPRRLVFRHARRCQQAWAGTTQGLAPGDEQLYSFLVPGIRGGKHTVDVRQEVEVDNTSEVLHGSQQFYVDAPEFQLPEGEIHSVYPPAGHEERAECLPHVVLNTPTFPWEWEASNKKQEPDFLKNRNRVPWLAVLVFTKEELQLAAEDLHGEKSLFKDIDSLKKGVKQAPTMSVHIPVTEVDKIHKTKSPIKPHLMDPETVSTDVILLPTKLFKEVFAGDDTDGGNTGAIDKEHPNVRPYRFLAHRRDINADGMAVASLMADDNDRASFSVVYSHRTGPVDMKEPTACIAHLISIRGVEGMNWPGDETRYVALSSLHSWTYTGLPPETPSVRDQFEELGRKSTLLQPPTIKANDLDPKVALGIRERLAARLHDGYTLARYRMQTGEATACFFRGPLIPVEIPETASRSWDWLSTSGQDLQVLDQALGLMDITLSAAWQLGRTLAMADQEFITRIGLVRKHIYDRAMELSQINAVKPHGGCSRDDLIAQLPQMVSELHQLPHVNRFKAMNERDYQLRRWFRQSVEPLNLSYQGLQTATLAVGDESIEKLFTQAAEEISSTPKEDGGPSDHAYNEYNIPYSADWMAVLKWILNRLYLATVPSHYLIPDTSALPSEAIRFFRVDWRWMDALIDGALSLANHHDQDKDLVRGAIWAAIKRYRESPVEQLGNALPPVPEYGCFIRSTLVSKFPDLRVQVEPPQEPPKPLVLLRHEIVSSDTMLCLFSQKPGSALFKGLSLTQPPHQQTFVAATKLNEQTIEMSYKKAYTVSIQNPDGKSIADPKWPRPERGHSVPVYRWETSQGVKVHKLLMENLAQNYLSTAQEKMDKSLFNEDIATSTLMAWQFGSVSYKLDFSVPALSTPQMYLTEIAQHRSEPHLPPQMPQIVPNQPAYHYKVCPVSNPTKTEIPILPIEQDLLFLINLEPYTDRKDLLEGIKITLPFAAPGPGKPALMQDYSGSGAEMITNIRLNVLVNIVRDERRNTQSLVLRLVPRMRSKDGGKTPPQVPLRSCHELSFVLNGVRVNQYERDTPVEYEVSEKYNDRLWRGPFYRSLAPIELVVPGTKQIKDV